MIKNEPMKNHTTFKLGGNADILCIPNNTEELRSILCLSNKFNIPITVIGNGSNILVRDKGIRGIVIKMADTMKYIINTSLSGYLMVSATVMIDEIIDYTVEHNLKGLEGLFGIPGTLGGCIYMNASYTKEIKNMMEIVKCMDYEGHIFYFTKEQLNFEYRKSMFHNKKYIILEATLKVEKGDCSEIVKKYRERRNRTQPLEYPSAGSIFKKNNLKEYQGLAVGEAEVRKSFIINKNNATAKDVIDLIDLIQGDKKLEIEIIGEG